MRNQEQVIQHRDRLFDRLPEDHVVQMFVTINAKHTRLNASHLVSLSGRQLYRDENLAAAHESWRQALAAFEDLQHPRAQQSRAKLPARQRARHRSASRARPLKR